MVFSPAVPRPFFNASVEDLERLADDAPASILRGILAELGHRRVTPRTAALQRRVRTRLGLIGTGATAPVAPPTPEPVPVAAVPSGRKPPPAGRVRNDPAEILAAWTALEVLSPQTYREPEDLVDPKRGSVARLDDGDLPWERGEKARPQTRLFYHLVLGAVRMENAVGALLAVYGDAHGDGRPARGRAPIAAITLDRNGRPLPDAVPVVSGFAWGLVPALEGDLRALGAWTGQEERLRTGLLSLLAKRDPDADGFLPLNQTAVAGAHAWLLRELRLPADLVEPPTFALRAYHWFAAPEPPEPPLLNSFFLNDLSRVGGMARDGALTPNLRRYLGLDPPPVRRNVLEDKDILEVAVRPGAMPRAAWPSPPGRALVLLQQGAVNLAASRAADAALLPVNGPPGTGKTTLLRDVVAAELVARATAMAAFDDPNAAFGPPATTLTVGGEKLALRPLHASLRGHEVLVVSSNNRAVENVSRELPGLEEVTRERDDLRHFRSVSDRLAEGRPTWGLIAAVLGNAGNRATFYKDAWKDPDHGLRAYLLEASGVPQWVQDPPVDGVPPPRRKPAVIIAESPPTRADAARRWAAARGTFRAAVARVDAILAEREGARRDAGALPGLAEALERLDANLAAAVWDADAAATRAGAARRERADAAASLADFRAAASAHAGSRPGLLTRLLGTARARAWRGEGAEIFRAVTAAERRWREAEPSALAAEASSEAARQRSAAASAARDAASAGLDAARSRVAAMRDRLGAAFLDADGMRAPHDALHRVAPWTDDTLRTARAGAFAAALALHRAFADAAAVPLRANLDILFRTFFSRAGWKPELRPHLAEAWASLFLLVPVASTTFASVERMLGPLGPGSLGLLLVDEAGQATPQSAVGALLRARRAVIVGDPLQIEPVTNLPDDLADGILAAFGVDPSRFGAPATSVQTRADEGAVLGATYRRPDGDAAVGWPLLVHRRCADPQFSVSNGIAYGGLMVHATPRRASLIRDRLAESRWLDVPPGDLRDKWSPDEGEVALDLIRRAAGGEAPPDIYLVTPFRAVAAGLRERARAARLPADWVHDRIGTVHTVQGREAEAVILVLGAPLPAQASARLWAGRTPNLPNVAITRAKEGLYVVGSRAAWGDAGYFRHLADALPSEPASHRLL